VGILLSRVGAVNIVFLLRAALQVFLVLLESTLVWTGLQREPIIVTSVRQQWQVLFAVAALLGLFSIVPDPAAAGERIYRVQGQVVAVNLTQTPHMIVVRTPLSKHNDMTVGAKVTAQTRITRKGKRIALQTIRVGEMVRLTYVKQRDGVFARMIQLQ
jgi:hypothetical protein